MSHYTVGTGSSPELQNIAVAANRARSQAYRDAFAAIGRMLGKKSASDLQNASNSGETAQASSKPASRVLRG